MQLCHIRNQILRNNDAAKSGQCICRFVQRKSYIVSQCVLAVCRSIHQYFLQCKAGRYLRKHFVDNCVNRSQICLQSFLEHLLNDQSLTLCTGEVSSGGRADPGVSCSLTSVEKLKSAFFYPMGFLSCRSRRLINILVNVLDLFLFDINLNTAQKIDRIRDRAEINCHIILDIQIQIHIEHIDRHNRTAVAVCGITFLICSFRKIKKRITVHGNHFNLFRLIVQTGNNNTICTVSLPEITITGINAKQRDICVSITKIQLLICLNFLVYYKIVRLNLLRVDLIPFCIDIGRPRTSHTNQDYRETKHNPLPDFQSGKPVTSLLTGENVPASSYVL